MHLIDIECYVYETMCTLHNLDQCTTKDQ